MSDYVPEKDEQINVKWDLTNAPPTFILIESIVNVYYYYLTIEKEGFMSEIQRELLWKTFSTKFRLKALLHLWKHGATTIPELVYCFKMGRQTAKNALDAFERAGLVVITTKLLRASGGNTSVIYAMPICGPEVSIAAQKRHDQRKGLASSVRNLDNYLDENEDIARDYDLHQEQEQADAELQLILEQVKAEFLSQYGADGNPVNLEDIQRSLRAKGMPVSDTDSTLKVAEYLEEEGITTGIYRNGVIAQGYKPSPTIVEIRNRRDS